MLRTQWESFIHVSVLRITEFSPLTLNMSVQKGTLPPVPHNLSLGSLSVSLFQCLYNPRFPARLQSDSQHGPTATQLKLKPSTVRINCLALSSCIGDESNHVSSLAERICLCTSQARDFLLIIVNKRGSGR